jgi:predicted MPP superfamily phosphohydrolase
VSTALAGLTIIAGIVVLHSILIAPRQLQTVNVDVELPNLAVAFDGYTIAVIADIHHWAPGTRTLRRLVTMTNDANPDLIVLLGDYGISFEHRPTWSAIAYRRALPALGDAIRGLTARDGCVAVLGNHDHYYDADHVADWLRRLGVRVLINDHTVLRRDGATLVIGGVGDAYEDRVDPGGGAGLQRPGTPIIVLSHNPDGVPMLRTDAGIGLVLAGHTHGGQIIVPGYGALTTHTRICGHTTPSGWIPNDVAPLYVTRGIGVQVPIRFRCPPELTIVRLRTPASHQHPV